MEKVATMILNSGENSKKKFFKNRRNTHALTMFQTLVKPLKDLPDDITFYQKQVQ